MQIFYKKYSFREFLSLPDEKMQEYESIGMLLKPNDWGVSEVEKWPYLTVKEIQYKLTGQINYQVIIDIIRELTGMKVEKILSKCWLDVFRFFKFVLQSSEHINELEQKLAYEPDPAEEKAGIEMYNQFGYFATLDRLAGGDPLKYEEVGKIEYSVIFSKLMLNKVDNQFLKNYQKAIQK